MLVLRCKVNVLHFNNESNFSFNWWQAYSSYFYPVLIPIFPLRALGVVSLLKAFQMSIRKCEESTSFLVVGLCSVAWMDVLTLNNCDCNTYSALQWGILHDFLWVEWVSFFSLHGWGLIGEWTEMLKILGSHNAQQNWSRALVNFSRCHNILLNNLNTDCVEFKQLTSVTYVKLLLLQMRNFCGQSYFYFFSLLF